MIKIGFIHFDGLHIIHHFIGSAIELFNDPECDVHILTPEINQEYLFSIIDLYKAPRSIVKKLPTYLFKKVAYKIQGREKPSNRFIFNKHMKSFLEYDILVFNVFNHAHVKRKGRSPKFVMLMHGAGDSHYPFLDIYKETVSQFDLITTSGKKINDLFNTMGNFNHTKFEICGYQKLDVVRKENKGKKLFDNNKPIILYNPHFKDYASSFHKMGMEILDFFYKNNDYNLVFAPHFNLFNPELKMALNRSIIDKKYYNKDNILIDLGSIKSVNMSYTISADVYLGDVSSQIYEFLISKTRPCIFVNAHQVDWNKDQHYQNWHLGKVINNIHDLDEVLKNREHWQKGYQDKQQKAIDYTFDISEISASKRVAKAIKGLIN